MSHDDDPLEAALDKMTTTCVAMLERAGKPTGNVRVRDFGVFLTAMSEVLAAIVDDMRDVHNSQRQLADEWRQLAEYYGRADE